MTIVPAKRTCSNCKHFSVMDEDTPLVGACFASIAVIDVHAYQTCEAFCDRRWIPIIPGHEKERSF